MLGHDPEPLPAIRGIGVGVGGGLQVPAGLGEGGVRRDEGVLGVGGAGSRPLTSRSASSGSPIAQRGANHRGEDDMSR